MKFALALLQFWLAAQSFRPSRFLKGKWYRWKRSRENEAYQPPDDA